MGHAQTRRRANAPTRSDLQEKHRARHILIGEVVHMLRLALRPAIGWGARSRLVHEPQLWIMRELSDMSDGTGMPSGRPWVGQWVGRCSMPQDGF